MVLRREDTVRSLAQEVGCILILAGLVLGLEFGELGLGLHYFATPGPPRPFVGGVLVMMGVAIWGGYYVVVE